LVPYIVIYTILTSLIFVRQCKATFYLLFIILSLFLTLSYTNGIDWTIYQLNYELEPFNTRGVEFGFTALSLTFYSLGFNFEFFKFVVLSINLYFILRFIFSETNQAFFTVLVLFQTFLLGNFFEPAFRQLQALTILLFGFKYLVSMEHTKYYITVAIGMLFHQSMIFLFVLPWIIKKVNFKSILLASIVATALSPFLNDFIALLTKIPVFSDYSYYLDKNFLKGIPVTPFNMAKLLVYSIPFYLLRGYKRDDATVNVMRALALVFLFCFTMQFSVMLFYRFNYYFVIFYVIYLSFILDLTKGNYYQKKTMIIL